MSSTTFAAPEPVLTGRRRALGNFGILVGCCAAVAASTAVLGADSGRAVSQTAAMAIYVVYGALLARHDIAARRLPNTLTLPLAAAVTGIVVGLVIGTGDVQNAVSALLGTVGLVVVLTVIGLAGHAGFGDVKLAFSVGLLTGWHGWYLPLLALLAAYLLALPHATIAVLRRRRGTAYAADLPFGPYLIAAGLLVAIWAVATGGY